MGYTSTEGGAVVANIGGPEYTAHPTSTGRVTVTTELEIRDPFGATLPEGEEGEVHVKSPYIMRGYWRDPAASEAVLKSDGTEVADIIVKECQFTFALNTVAAGTLVDVSITSRNAGGESAPCNVVEIAVP